MNNATLAKKLSFTQIIGIIPIIFVLLFGSGCAALLIGGGVAAGAGTFAYTKGDMKIILYVKSQEFVSYMIKIWSN